MSSSVTGYREYLDQLTSLRARLWRSLPKWWSSLADTLGIAAVITAPFVAQAQSTALFLVAGAAAAALVAGVVLHRRSRRNSRYAYAMAGLHSAVHIFRDEMATVDEWSDKGIKTCLTHILSAFCTTFAIIIGAPCRACIKVVDVVPPEGKKREEIPLWELVHYCYARTFCRDLATHAQIGELPEERTAAPVSHNTAFRFLFDDVRKRHFLGNNLPKMQGYQNTSVHKYAIAGDKRWGLPYSATMVWPIRMVTSKDLGAPAVFTGQQDIIGYLAIDSIAINVFHEEIDFEVGALLADALYVFFDQVIPTQRMEKENNGKDSTPPSPEALGNSRSKN